MHTRYRGYETRMRDDDDGADEAALTDGAPLAFLLTETTTIVTHRTTVVLLDAAGQCHFQGVDMTRGVADRSGGHILV